MKLTNKISVVTGAGQGMGRTIVQHFVEQGATVYAVDVNAEALEQTVKGLNGKAHPVVCDITDESAVTELMSRIDQDHGRLDVLVNNAGIGSVDSLLETPLDTWQRVINVNLTGAFLCSREAVRIMTKTGQGSIINFSSTAAQTGEGPCHYVASKAGMMGLTRSTARELAASGIRVNSLVPGATDTPMMADIPKEWMDAMIQGIPLGRLCETIEIARVVAFLGSDDASFITGQNIAVNGGMAFL
ncbi:SDR family NAD(P)-dependent oxidoreductase [Marinobacter sp. X15-166B]|uniref:SDR family NAD(P)-dependent oxidoreductase n=1 Tax=Marinobacter sp. X15-166B TaxID=1897620 RepID=UPI00085BF7CC|nr:glucose 1-dehydrogenase [Marinobacter sp. X15-166B]OEY66341.1 3-oxoacyl-ACP reductase [Marinobacter sp. X15-166B]